jgi:hypothetical protein
MLPRSIQNLLLLLSIILVVIGGVTTTKKSKKKKPYQYDTSRYVNICLSKPTLQSSRDHKALQWLLQTSGERSIQSEKAHQHKAACWILHSDKKSKAPSKRFSQRYALAVLYYATQGDKYWEIKTNWMSGSKSECTWYGVECDAFGTVIGLELGFNALNGLLPRELALLQNVKEVDFHGNDLQGIIPHGIMFAWKDCKILRLHMNGFFGNLHSEISHMKSLEELHVFGNYLQGTLPKEIASLKKLKVLDVYANAFEGRIPTQLGNLKHLKELDVHDNFFVGTMPQEVCDRKLNFLVADCLEGAYKEIGCKCCTICCEGLPNMRCIDQVTKKQVIVGMQ